MTAFTFPTSPITGQMFTSPTGAVYKFTNGGWELQLGSNLTQPLVDGNTIMSTGTPVPGLGINGDYYVDTLTGLVYGPKAAGAWPATGNPLGVIVSAANTFSAPQTFKGNATGIAANVQNVGEAAEIFTTYPLPVQTLNLANGSVKLFAAPISNWVFNLTHSPTQTLNGAMAIGEAITIAALVQQGGTAFYPTSIQIDGAAVPVNWLGGSAPYRGNASALEAYQFTVIKTAASTFTVLGSQVKY